MPFLEAGSREKEIGLEVFCTTTPGIGGKLRKSPEDFIVEEISSHPDPSEDGRFTIAKVTSQNWETNRLIRQLSKNLGISRSKIGFAGTKDKRAVTTQLMSFEAPLEAVSTITLHQVTISDAYRSRKQITIGDLIGNAFKVAVRDTSLQGDDLKEAIEGTRAIIESLGGFPNFFGVQRFGALRPVTHTVGKHIVQGDFERAVMAYAGNPTADESPEAREARRQLEATRDFEAAIRTYPRKLTFERMVIGHLARHPGDYVGALRTLPSNLQMMFVHAFQSYLFNRILSERIRRGMPLNLPLVGDVVLPIDRRGQPDHDKHVPVTASNIDLIEKQVRNGKAFVSAVLFGSDSVFAEGPMGELERKVVEAEGVSHRDFLVPQMPQCSSKGTRREILAQYHRLSVETNEDWVLFSFSLGKGCYATSFLREFMKADTLDY